MKILNVWINLDYVTKAIVIYTKQKVTKITNFQYTETMRAVPYWSKGTDTVSSKILYFIN